MVARAGRVAREQREIEVYERQVFVVLMYYPPLRSLFIRRGSHSYGSFLSCFVQMLILSASPW